MLFLSFSRTLRALFFTFVFLTDHLLANEEPFLLAADFEKRAWAYLNQCFTRDPNSEKLQNSYQIHLYLQELANLLNTFEVDHHRGVTTYQSFNRAKSELDRATKERSTQDRLFKLWQFKLIRLSQVFEVADQMMISRTFFRNHNFIGNTSAETTWTEKPNIYYLETDLKKLLWLGLGQKIRLKLTTSKIESSYSFVDFWAESKGDVTFFTFQKGQRRGEAEILEEERSDRRFKRLEEALKHYLDNSCTERFGRVKNFWLTFPSPPLDQLTVRDQL